MSHSWVTSSANLANLTALLPVASKYVLKFTRMKGVRTLVNRAHRYSIPIGS
jgi:hypothetical protein